MEADITVISEARYNSLEPTPPLQSSTALLRSQGGTVTYNGEINAVLLYKSGLFCLHFRCSWGNVNCLLC